MCLSDCFGVHELHRLQVEVRVFDFAGDADRCIPTDVLHDPDFIGPFDQQCRPQTSHVASTFGMYFSRA
jgi:hypothetical protein